MSSDVGESSNPQPVVEVPLVIVACKERMSGKQSGGNRRTKWARQKEQVHALIGGKEVM